MATTTSIVFKNGQMTSFYDHQTGYLGGSSRISKHGKEYNYDGWKVTVKNGGKNRPGKIICHTQFDYFGCVLTHHKEYPLSDGTLNLEAEFGEIHSNMGDWFDGYPEYDMLYYCNFKESKPGELSSTELLRQMFCPTEDENC